MSGICEQYRAKLFELAEPEYQKFASSLIPNTDNVLGVRVPLVRRLARELSASDWREYFERNEDKYFEETLLQGLTIGYLKEDIETVLFEAQSFIPKIANWSVCDSFCGGLKITKAHKERVWKFLMDYIKSDKTYYVRFAVVMMLWYYIDDEYTAKMLKLLDEIKSEDYYVKMAVAWAVSMCYVNQPAVTIPFLRDNKLDDFTFNKSLQKICESLKPSAEEKAVIKSMKRRPAKQSGAITTDII